MDCSPKTYWNQINSSFAKEGGEAWWEIETLCSWPAWGGLECHSNVKWNFDTFCKNVRLPNNRKMPSCHPSWWQLWWTYLLQSLSFREPKAKRKKTCSVSRMAGSPHWALVHTRAVLIGMLSVPACLRGREGAGPSAHKNDIGPCFSFLKSNFSALQRPHMVGIQHQWVFPHEYIYSSLSRSPHLIVRSRKFAALVCPMQTRSRVKC